MQSRGSEVFIYFHLSLSYTLLERGQDAAGGLGGRIVSLLQSEFHTTD